MDPGGDRFLQKGKILSGSFLGGVWVCYLGSQVHIKEVKGFGKTPWWSFGWILEETDFSRKRKTSWVASLEESGAATWGLRSLRKR